MSRIAPQVSGAHPDVFNYAGLGFILGGLLFNAIDAKGSLRDADGVLQPWWSNSSREQFSSAVQCLEELFQLDSRFIREEIGETVATCVAFSAYERHVEEVEAARSGLWDRLAAWLTWPVWLIGRTEYEFADDQVFFLNRCFCFCSRIQSLLDTAEWTSPAQRCNLPLKNSPEFWRAFGCRRGDQMRAETSCQLI
ncbi:hypothetical protein HPB48_019626 [Haemaphysalis longicornis]|uniref:Peptidase M13 C-terminal domain-containing protein n=1 Tax=Haemaphysalis longicornis TaxID=44386 RepID=A0A9J6FTE5_HAELO|nr:hypothetical protein HPB48_019626 [Haemaphysalis longicornis]